MQSHIRKVYACLAVTFHLRFWQNGRGLLRATVVTRGWNGYRNNERPQPLKRKYSRSGAQWRRLSPHSVTRPHRRERNLRPLVQRGLCLLYLVLTHDDHKVGAGRTVSHVLVPNIVTRCQVVQLQTAVKATNTTPRACKRTEVGTCVTWRVSCLLPAKGQKWERVWHDACLVFCLQKDRSGNVCDMTRVLSSACKRTEVGTCVTWRVSCLLPAKGHKGERVWHDACLVFCLQKDRSGNVCGMTRVLSSACKRTQGGTCVTWSVSCLLPAKGHKGERVWHDACLVFCLQKDTRGNVCDMTCVLSSACKRTQGGTCVTWRVSCLLPAKGQKWERVWHDACLVFCLQKDTRGNVCDMTRVLSSACKRTQGGTCVTWRVSYLLPANGHKGERLWHDACHIFCLQKDTRGNVCDMTRVLSSACKRTQGGMCVTWHIFCLQKDTRGNVCDMTRVISSACKRTQGGTCVTWRVSYLLPAKGHKGECVWHDACHIFCLQKDTRGNVCDMTHVY